MTKMHRIPAVLVLAMFLSGAAFAQNEPARGRGKGWAFDAGLEFLRRQEWESAIKMFEEAFDDMPGDQEIQGRLLEAKAESAKARAAAGGPSVIRMLCTPDPNPEGRMLQVGPRGAAPIQESVKVRIDTAGKVVELRSARDNYLLDRNTSVVVSESSYSWAGREMTGGGRLSGSMDRATGRLTTSWLHEKAATDIPPSLEAFVGVCRAS